LNLDFSEHFLPKHLLDHFELIAVHELFEISSKLPIFYFDLVEINKIPEGFEANLYESKGFLSEKLIQDFPIRGKAVYLNIKRRRWRAKSDKNSIIQNDYSFIAESSKLTIELSDFLKDTGRDSSRYDK
jgi:hypothetical protein